jgi:alcohol dehydrogenase
MQQGQAFSFELPTRIEFGQGMIETLANELQTLEAGSVLLVTDEGVRNTAFFPRIETILNALGVRWSLFDRVEANPKDRDVEEGSRLAEELGADCIIAVGGGSPIDCAKAMSITAVSGGPVQQYREKGAIGSPGLPVIAIPTTAGTGSEVTFSSVITDSKEKFKFTLKSPHIGPVVALLDPQLTLTMPPQLTAATGMDALTHAIEAYTAQCAEPISDALALQAIERITAAVKQAYHHGDDIQARENMLAGSLLAGIAFSHSDVAAVHCLAEAIGGVYDLPHGVCNAVMLPEVVAYNLDYARARYDRVARAAGITAQSGGGGSDALVAYLRGLLAELDLPSLTRLGVRGDDVRELAEKAAQNGSNASNPRPMKSEDYVKLLEALLGPDAC